MIVWIYENESYYLLICAYNMLYKFCISNIYMI